MKLRCADIYALLEKDTQQIRYVGMAINPDIRVPSHFKDALKPNHKSYKVSWIRKMMREDRIIQVMILERSCTNPQEREIYWIKRLRSEGHKLTNMTDGGEGLLNPTSSTRKRHRVAVSKGVRELWNNKEFATRRRKQMAKKSARSKISNSVRKLWQDPEYRKRNLNSYDRSAVNKKRWSDPKKREEQSRKLKEANKDPEVYARKIAALQRNGKNPITRAKHSEAMRKRWQDPVYATKARKQVSALGHSKLGVIARSK